MTLIHIIDDFLNSITMYRLILYGLFILAAISIVFGFLKLLPFSAFSLLISLTVLLTICYFTNRLFAGIFKAVVNNESSFISALILFFILAPVNSQTDLFITILAGTAAMASKYFIAIRRKHIFNPTAAAVFFLALLGFGNEIWWVGSDILFPLVLILGFLVVRKLRRFTLFFVFLIPTLITTYLFNLKFNISIFESIVSSFTSWPLIFFGTIMLTEPQTSPQIKRLLVPYGILVGIISGAQFSIGPIYSSPILALFVGNLFSYLVSPKYKLFLNLKEKREIGPGIYEFKFSSPLKPQFTPGQYMEWTLPIERPDVRGNRRYFTIASSPNEDLMIGVKLSEASSAFKKELLNLSYNLKVVASSLAGDFTLPADKDKKLVFIAGGIGITPFRSILKSLLEEQEKRDIVVFYTSLSEKEFVFKDVLKEAEEKLGIKVVYVITDEKNIPENWKGEKGFITEDMLKKNVSELKERLFYLSGPSKMVDSYKKLLGDSGVSWQNITTDYFPGY